jgi:hypothetical protein
MPRESRQTVDEPMVTRATIRIEYADGRVHELDVPNPRDAQVDVTSPELPGLQPFNPAYLLSIPAPTPFWRVALTMDATPSMRDASRCLITAAEKPYVLDPALMPYLDWPLYFPDDSVHCNRFPHCKNRWCADPDEGAVYIASGRRLTVREFLADIKAHAEDTLG